MTGTIWTPGKLAEDLRAVPEPERELERHKARVLADRINQRPEIRSYGQAFAAGMAELIAGRDPERVLAQLHTLEAAS
ncbi:MAG TPA: hypothetical protein VGH09_06565 [Solirubrobacteraceae bacterium]